MQAAKRSIGIGIIGLGTVGGGVAQLLLTHRADYVSAYGIDIDVRRGCALDIGMARAAGLPDDRFTPDWHDVVTDPTVDIVVELIGGEHPATEIYEAAFAAGKHVVTANKALLGRHVERLAKLAHDAGVQIKCEAAAAGGIPVVNALEHTLVGNKILTIAGILNGTTNYILSRMASEGADYADVLADAQRLGYAEADPSADVDGFDAASKTAIMASIGFHTRVTTDEVYQQGIRQVSAEDIAVAADMGYTIKLLGIARMTAAGVEARVHPTMIPNGHQLAAVSGAMNAVYVVGDAVGETMFYGAGAGRFPTPPPWWETSSRWLSPCPAARTRCPRSNPSAPWCPCCPSRSFPTASTCVCASSTAWGRSRPWWTPLPRPASPSRRSTSSRWARTAPAPWCSSPTRRARPT